MRKSFSKRTALGLCVAALAAGCGGGASTQGGGDKGPAGTEPGPTGSQAASIVQVGPTVFSGCTATAQFAVSSPQSIDFIAAQGGDVLDMQLYTVDEAGRQQSVHQQAQSISSSLSQVLGTSAAHAATAQNAAAAGNDSAAHVDTTTAVNRVESGAAGQTSHFDNSMGAGDTAVVNHDDAHTVDRAATTSNAADLASNAASTASDAAHQVAGDTASRDAASTASMQAANQAVLDDKAATENDATAIRNGVAGTASAQQGAGQSAGSAASNRVGLDGVASTLGAANQSAGQLASQLAQQASSTEAAQGAQSTQLAAASKAAQQASAADARQSGVASGAASFDQVGSAGKSSGMTSQQLGQQGAAEHSLVADSSSDRAASNLGVLRKDSTTQADYSDAVQQATTSSSNTVGHDATQAANAAAQNQASQIATSKQQIAANIASGLAMTDLATLHASRMIVQVTRGVGQSSQQAQATNLYQGVGQSVTATGTFAPVAPAACR